MNEDKNGEAPKPDPTNVPALRAAIQGLSAKKRLDAILERHDVMKVVRAMPVQDLFVTVREVGVGDALELIELLSPQQVQGFLDLDAWRRDRLDPGSTADWLEALYAANPDRAVRQILGLDVELLTLLLKMYTRVYDLSAEEEVPGDPKHVTITPDQRYCVVYDDEHEKLALALKQTIERLFAVDMKRVLGLLESVRWETPSTLEEEGFRWRNGRMADLGFLPTDEALEVFAWVDPDAPGEAPPVTPPPTEGEAAPDLSMSVLLRDERVGAGALGAALAQIDDADKARVLHELVLVANRVHVAMGADPGDPAALGDTLQRVCSLVGIGVAYLGKGDPAQGATSLSSTATLRLFQVGHSVTTRLGRELRARMKAPGSGLGGHGVLRLDAPLREVAAGVLKPRPLFYAGLTEPGRVDFIPFRSLEDVAQAASALTEAAFRAGLVGEKGLGGDDATLTRAGIFDAQTGPSHGALLCTWLARALLALPAGFEPLEEAHLEALQEKIGDVEPALKALDAAAAQAAPLPGAAEKDAAAKRARLFALQALEVLKQELEAEDVDARYVRAVFTSAWAQEQIETLDEEGDDE
jgi:hypothetical protein